MSDEIPADQLPAIPNGPLHAKELENQIVCSRTLDAATRQAITDQMKWTLLGLLTNGLIRDARALGRCKIYSATDCDRLAYVTARRQTIADYQTLYPEQVSQVTQVKAIDILASCKPVS